MKKHGLIAGIAMLIFGVIFLSGCPVSEEEPTVIPLPTTDIQLEGSYGTNVYIPAGSSVLLTGKVLFYAGSLVISNGVTFYGNFNVDTLLLIDKGAKIEALGTLANPITFTSGKPAGTRGQQDWGGIVINGDAQINAGTEAQGEGGSGLYGGNNDSHNGGTLNYVRVYFAGKDINQTDELNGVAFQGVGNGTIVDYLQAHNCKDDGVEMFGGNLNLKHVISTGNGDDQVDCTYGWRGFAQFIVAAGFAGDEGFEHDNNGSDNEATPRGHVVYYNITAVDNAADGGAAYFREGVEVVVNNGLFVSESYGIKLRQDGGVTDGTKIWISNSMIQSSATNYYDIGAITATNIDSATITTNSTISQLTPADYQSLAVLETVGADAFAPSSSIAGGVDGNAFDTWFDTANYIGAIESKAVNWADTWTSFPAN